MREALAYLSRLCTRWGGTLAVLPVREFRALKFQEPGVSGAPDGWHAIDIERRCVITAEGHTCPGDVIHEMGHLFLVEAEPEVTDEWPWFGWEIVLARQAGCYRAWSISSRAYGVGSVYEGVHEGMCWGDLVPQQKRRVIADRIAHAKAVGLVSQAGVALCTRS